MLVAYAFELLFILVFYISQLTGRGTTGDGAYNVIHRCRCPPATAHEKCTGGVGECGYFTIIIHSERCDTFRECKQPTGRGWQHRRAMKETTPSFLDAAIFFALSVGIAGIGTSPSEGFTGYEVAALQFSALLILSPLYIVLALSSKTLRRRRLRRNLVSLVVILFFAAVSAPVPLPPPGGGRVRRWDAICYSHSYNSRVFKGVVPITIIVSAFAIECLRVLGWLCRLSLKRYLPNWWSSIKSLSEVPGSHHRYLQYMLGFWKRYIYYWASRAASIWVVATIGSLLALFGGISLAIERATMQEVAGKDYQESKMTYGQYLAMLIWVPVLVEYTYVAICKCTALPPDI